MNTPTPGPALKPTPYFGKYRGLVTNNVDPQQIGRILVEVPDVLGPNPSGWALPCVPAAGLGSGIFVVPPVGSSVWVEFEGGQIDTPIWTGGFWPSAADVPPAASAPAPIPPGQNIVILTTGRNMLGLSDAPETPDSGGVILKSASGASIILNSSGIYLSNGQGATLSMTGPAVTINGNVFLPP
jgi:uncharacterized protein involved in type VI secretion and phage assembly